MTLGELIQQIGTLIISYERSNNMREYEEENATKLLKMKDVINMYPALTLYSLNKAIKEERLPVIKIGNLNYFTKEDIEKFLKLQTIRRGNNLQLNYQMMKN